MKLSSNKYFTYNNMAELNKQKIINLVTGKAKAYGYANPVGKSYWIYILISPVGKYYIGQTVDISRRMTQYKYNHKYSYKGSHINQAIRKYGWDNFKKYQFKVPKNKKLLNELEIELIKRFDSTNNKKGYNISKGGRYYEVNDEFRKKAKENAINFWKKEDSIEKHRKARERSGNSKPIYQLSKDGMTFIKEWRSVAEASLYISNGKSKSRIWDVLNGRKPSMGGYFWLRKYPETTKLIEILKYNPDEKPNNKRIELKK